MSVEYRRVSGSGTTPLFSPLGVGPCGAFPLFQLNKNINK